MQTAFKRVKERGLLLWMKNKFNEIKPLPDSLRRKRKLKALHPTNMAGALAKLLKTNSHLNGSFIISVMFPDMRKRPSTNIDSVQ